MGGGVFCRIFGVFVGIFVGILMGDNLLMIIDNLLMLKKI